MSLPLDRLKTAFKGRFIIESEIGRGGMSVVYLAFDIEENRQVALKVLRPELTASVGGERFLREIQYGMRLNHPHILAIHRSGQADGFLFYTMPYVEGESLRKRLERERQLPLEEGLEIARNVASALEYAHKQGVIHRDIKPENILLSSGGPVVMDFGIARAVDLEGEERLTKTGLAMGTPAYMSPEQSESGVHLDGRADQYSLACVLYEMFAGHPPFMGSSAQVVLNRHARDPVPPLSSARPTVSVPIETVVHKALAKVPADRFRSARKFSDALHMAEQGVTPRGVTPIAIRPERGGFLYELKRRRVYQVGVGYAVVAWALAQVLDAVAEPLGIPPEVHRVVIWVSIGGFPIALALAWLFDLTPQGIHRTQAVPLTPRTGTQLARRHRLALGVAVVAVAVIGFMVSSFGFPGIVGGSGGGPLIDLSTVTPRDLEPNDVVVLPFRVSGADPSMGEGVANLLDAALHGEASDKTWDLSTVSSLHTRVTGDRSVDLTHEQGLQIAAYLGAGRLIQGASVVGTLERVTISASIERVPTGTPITQESVEGPSDSLSSLVTRLAALLLHRNWNDAVSRQELSRVPAPAMEAYLTAVRASWRGDGATAVASAKQALDLYPDFPAAAFIEWNMSRSPEATDRAWALRDRMSDRERTWMTVTLGPSWPDEWEGAAEMIEIAEAEVEEHPTWPELKDRLAFLLWQFGEYVGRTDAWQARVNLMERERELLEGEEDYQGVWMMRTRGWDPDTTGLRALAALHLADATPPRSVWDSIAPYDVAAVFNDTRALDSLRAAGIHALEPHWFRTINLLEGRPGPDPLYDTEAAIDDLEARAITMREGVLAYHHRMVLAEVRGEVTAAAEMLDSLARIDPQLAPLGAERDRLWYLTVPIEHHLVEPGWEASADSAARELIRRDELGSWYGEFDQVCWPELEKMLRGDLSMAAEASRRMWEMRAGQRSAGGICAALIDALVEKERRPLGPTPALERLDSLMRRGPRETLMGSANLVIAQLYAARGDTARALEAVRRRPYHRYVFRTFPAYLALEAHLSAATGDTERAMQAATHYLRLRPDPDPPLRPQRDEVQALLQRLTDEERALGGGS